MPSSTRSLVVIVRLLPFAGQLANFCIFMSTILLFSDTWIGRYLVDERCHRLSVRSNHDSLLFCKASNIDYIFHLKENSTIYLLDKKGGEKKFVHLHLRSFLLLWLVQNCDVRRFRLARKPKLAHFFFCSNLRRERRRNLKVITLLLPNHEDISLSSFAFEWPKKEGRRG